MDRDRRLCFGWHLYNAWDMSGDALFALLSTAAACNVDEGKPVDVLAIIAESGRAIIWC